MLLGKYNHHKYVNGLLLPLIILVTYALPAASEMMKHKHISSMKYSEESAACDPAQVAPSLACAKAPSAEFDNEGQLWVIWSFGQHLYLSSSSDKGINFSTSVRVNLTPENIAARGENRPKIALDQQGNIYISWTRSLSKPYTGDIRFSHSRDGGKHFSAPITINDNRDIITHRFDSMSVTETGRVYLAWLDKRDKVKAEEQGDNYSGAALYYTYADIYTSPHADTYAYNGNIEFQPNMKIADNTCECCRLAMVLDRNALPIIMWRDIYEDNIRDHSLVRFINENKAAPSTRVSHDQWQINACPHHGPALSINTDNVIHATWFNDVAEDESTVVDNVAPHTLNNHIPGKHTLFYARSTNDGATFSEPVGFGNYGHAASHPYVIALEQKVFLVWKEFDGKETHIQQMRSDDGGVSWSHSTSIAVTTGQSDHPLLIRDQSQAYLSWQTSEEGYRLIALKNNALDTFQ